MILSSELGCSIDLKKKAKWLSFGTDYCITLTPPFVSKDFNKYTILNNNTPHSEQRRTVSIRQLLHTVQ